MHLYEIREISSAEAEKVMNFEQTAIHQHSNVPFKMSLKCQSVGSKSETSVTTIIQSPKLDDIITKLRIVLRRITSNFPSEAQCKLDFPQERCVHPVPRNFALIFLQGWQNFHHTEGFLK